MINVPQTLRFVAENVSVRWLCLTQRERDLCLLRMRAALPEFTADAPESGMLLLRIAEVVETQDNAVRTPVPPRSFSYLQDPGSFSARSVWGSVRAGADDHFRHATHGERN